MGQWSLTHLGIVRSESFVGHNSSVYSRKAFQKARGYPIQSWGADTALDTVLKTMGPPALGELQQQDWQYLYRWGVSDLHISAIGGPDALEASWTASGRKVHQAGRYVLQPKWLYQYQDLVQKAARSGLQIYPTPDLEFWV